MAFADLLRRWQQCNCSTQQSLDPNLPWCSVDDCVHGFCTYHDNVTGMPKPRLDRFPDMKNMVEKGHAMGLKVGIYLNNCICMEAGNAHTHYEEDAAWLVSMGFDEVKIDNCGNSQNVTRCKWPRANPENSTPSTLHSPASNAP